MQPNISRRDLSKRLAGGAALLALQPAWNYLAAAQSLRNEKGAKPWRITAERVSQPHP